jgi:TRAP-type C4-dicarboxylate transport system permease small subunit
MPLALIALATALAANVILGPLVLAQIQWRVSANALNQTYGADAVSLVLVVPAALVAAALWRRRHPAAAPLALGVGLATLYYAVAETLGGDYLRYPGNNERFFLLFLALIVLGWTIAARAWTRIEPVRVSARFRRVVAVVLAVGAVPVALAWIAQLVAIAAGTDLGAAYEESPSSGRSESSTSGSSSRSPSRRASASGAQPRLRPRQRSAW